MVLFFSSTALAAADGPDAAAPPPVTLYMGKDKFENEDLIRYAWPQDVWFHVDKLSSAHVYLRLPDRADGAPPDAAAMSWDALPEALLADCAQLVKANSIEGNKKDNLMVIYTPASNLKKTGDMAVGQVSFKSDKKVLHVAKRENAVVNRLNKTKVERAVDHEQERVDRLKRESTASRAVANAKRKEAEELARQRAAEKAARDYALLDQVDDEDEGGEGGPQRKQQSVQEMMDDFM
ncbi:cytoplasmic protein [Phellopilus nigrolimitatus]|nr:cytoplasmic protein [Phellopilus nigrolimitatus]